MQGKPRTINFSRPSLLMLAILCYKWGGTVCSEKGSARTYLYEELHTLFPDSFGQRKHGPVRHDKESVRRKMRDRGHIVLSPPLGSVTRTIAITPAGTRHLRKGLDDLRYHDELQLIRDYFTVNDQKGAVKAVKPLIEVLEEVAEVEVIKPAEEIQPEIAIAPSWDHEPAEERVGWAVLSGGEKWHVINDDMVALTDAIRELIEVRAIYPLTVANAIPPRG
jgi:hypothetical protein